MKNLLIGSRALNYWLGDKVKINESTDWDIISEENLDPDSKFANYEWHNADILNNHAVENYASDETIEFNGHTVHVVHIIGLALIKRSHLWRDLSFDKHITHYSKHLALAVELANESDRKFLADRTTLTKKMFPQGNPNLMQSKEDFFDDAVTKKYDHDFLHELFAYHDKPLYTRLLRDPNLAWCEESKWNELGYTDKVRCVAEEVQVIATERFLIPKNWDYPVKLAYYNALKKVCTTLCSGWFRDFAIDNFIEIMQIFESIRFMNVKEILERNENAN